MGRAIAGEPVTRPARKILVIEDGRELQYRLRGALDGWLILAAEDAETATAAVRSERPPVVVLNLGVTPGPARSAELFRTLDDILATAAGTKVIVVTGRGDRTGALRAVAAGAFDVYLRPIDRDELVRIVEHALWLHELEEENRRRARVHGPMPIAGIVTADPEMIRICRQVERVAPTEVSVLLLGESGTGKELLAKAIHDLSPRRTGPFSVINCAAIPEGLLESELFGHERGAFTGAISRNKGKIELAHGGTLLLDEVGDIPLGVQVKLLRFLQERVLERVGGRQRIAVDVRIVCATNRDLDALIASGAFREDLYYRISEMVVRIPPLRERAQDAELLANRFLATFSEEGGRALKGFSGAALAAIAAHDWPGNVRELENRVKRAVIMAEGSRIDAGDLDLDVPEAASEIPSLAEARERAERREIPRALARAHGNISRAAKLLGISRPTLYDLMRQHGIRAESARQEEREEPVSGAQ